MWGVSEQTLNYSSAQMRFQNYVFYFVAGIYSYDSNCVEKKKSNAFNIQFWIHVSII